MAKKSVDKFHTKVKLWDKKTILKNKYLGLKCAE